MRAMRTYGYADGSWHNVACHTLAFDAEFRATLPADGMNGDWFDAILLDTETGKTFQVKHDYIAIETIDYFDTECSTYVKAFALHEYVYAAHWCGCHRIDAIEKAGGEVENVEPDDDENYCPAGRFRVVRMWHRSRPELTLFSEDVPVHA